MPPHGVSDILNHSGMAGYFVDRRGFRSFVKGLVERYLLYGTTLQEGFPVFKKIETPEELVLSSTPTHLSPKEFLFPPEELLLRFSLEDGRGEPVVDAPEQVLMGLHPCDIHAIGLLDRVFSHGTGDVNYIERRRRTILIGTECLPDEYCFCHSMGTMDAEEGFDLFFHELKRGYLVRVGTERGRRLLERYSKPARADRTHLEEMRTHREKKLESFVRSIYARREELPLVYAGSYEHPVWERIGSRCYGCGSCNHVCPTCYCFDIRDDVTLDLKEAHRYRVWDGCTLEDFAKVAGGHNFRRHRSERLRHRFNRKFRYLADRFDGLFCVGCGRCSRTCLVGINITDVTNELIRDARS